MQVVVSGDFSGQYTVDSYDFWSRYGWMIESGSDDLLQLHKSKEVYSKDWKGQNGKQYDLSKRFFEDKIVTFSGYMIADSKDEFWTNYLAFWDLLKSPGARSIYSYELEQTFSAFYLDSPNPKRFTRLQEYPNKIAMKLDIQFQVMFMEFDPPVNVPRPPVVNAGGNRIITLPTSQAVISGASATPRGVATIVSLLWEFVSGVSGVTTSITGGGTLTPTFTGLISAGGYNFKLTATDSNGLSASSAMSITVNPATATPAPIVNAGPDRTIRLSDAAITLSGASATATALGATITTISWAYEYSIPNGLQMAIQNSSTLTPRLYNPSAPSGSPLAIGVYTVGLTVVDSKGSQSYDDMILTVVADEVSAGLPYTLPLTL